MNKELQDLAWSCLPKEFKEEVKYEYRRVATKVIKSNYDLGFMNALEGMYGHHNLNSDAEGDEMLTVSRKRVQELYNRFEHAFDNVVSDNLMGHYRAKIGLLRALFGSKCLPDETRDKREKREIKRELNEDNFAKSEPKSSEAATPAILATQTNRDRLHIATMAMQGILSNIDLLKKVLETGMETLDGDGISYRAVAKASFLFADALITESKGGDTK